MPADLAGFRVQFPEFASTDDAAVNRALGEALEIHSTSTRASLYLVAHLLTLNAGPQGIGAGAGEATAKRAGPLSANYRTMAEKNRESIYTATSYGRRFLALEQRSPRSAIGAMVV